MRRTHLYGILLVILLLMVATVSAQSLNPIDIHVYDVEDTYYPAIDVYFKAFDKNSGEVISANENLLSATFGGQPMEVKGVETSDSAERPVNIAIVFDLTDSLSGTDFLHEQQRTASLLIEGLNPADQVSVVSFDTNEARIDIPLSGDHNAALNLIDTLRIVPGPVNTFYDGVLKAVEALQANPDPQARQAVVIMTDVTKPKGQATPDQAISLAQQLNIPLYLIGFNDADRSVLEQYSAPTRGFTYILRDMEEDMGLDRLARNVSSVIMSEYIAHMETTVQADDQTKPLILTVNLGGTQGVYQEQAVARPRPITITFPNLENRGPVADEVTFEPKIVYADTQETPEIVSAEYGVLTGGIGETLKPADSSNPVYTWDIADVSGGDYSLRLDVVDSLGNRGSGTFTITVASPMTVTIKQPAPSADAPDELPMVSPGLIQVEADIISSFSINEVKLFVDGQQVGTTLKTAPFIFEWDANDLAGQYELQVVASDLQDNEAQASTTVHVSLGTTTPWEVLIAIAIIALIIIIMVILILVRRQRTPEEAPQSPVTPPVMPSPPPSPQRFPQLRVLRGIADNNTDVYALTQGEMSVGRARDNTIRVVGEEASRHHGIIMERAGRFVYRDLYPEKGNIAHINGQPLQGEYTLYNGDRLIIGNTEMVFEDQ